MATSITNRSSEVVFQLPDIYGHRSLFPQEAIYVNDTLGNVYGALGSNVSPTLAIAGGVTAPAGRLVEPVVGSARSIFVSPAGSAEADGLTATTPITLDAALKRFSYDWGGRASITFASGQYSLPTSSPVYKLGRKIGAFAGPIELIGSMADVGLGTRVLTSNAALATPSATQIVDSGLAMTVDQYRGRWIEFLTGAATGRRYQIRNNTATAFTLNFGSGSAVIGDTFRVVVPAVNIQVDATVQFRDGDFVLSGIRLHRGASGPASINLQLRNTIWRHSAVHVDSRTNARRIRVQVAADPNNYGSSCEWDQQSVSVASVTALQTLSGTWLQGPLAPSFSNTLAAISAGNSFLGGAAVMDNGNVTSFNVGSTVELLPWDSIGGFMSVGGGSRFLSFPFGAYTNNINTTGLATPALTLSFSTGFSHSVGSIGVSGSLQEGIKIQQDATVDFSLVTGTANTTYGVTLSRKSFLVVSAGNNTITGTSGDVLMGATAKTWAGDFSVANTSVQDARFNHVEVI